MAVRKLVLGVEVEGVDKVVGDISQLEQSLIDMKSQLTGLKDGTPEFQALSKSIQDTEAQLNKLSGAANQASQSINNTAQATDNATQEQASLNQQIGEGEDKLMLMAQAGDTTSAAYKKLVAEVGQMKRVQIETNAQIDRAAAGFSGKMVLGIQRVASAYQVGMAATQMFGVESEKAQAIMAKLQAVMAFTQGIDQLKQLTTGMQLFGKGGVAAMSGIQKAITATGIGALVVAVGLLVAYWDDIVSFISGGVSEQEKLVEAAKKNVGVAEQQLTAFDNQVNSLRLQGKSEKEILALRIKRIDAVIQEQETYVQTMEDKQKMEVAAAKRNQEITEGIIRGLIEMSVFSLRLIAAPIDVMIETANALSDALGFGKITSTNLNKEINKLAESGAKSLSKMFFDPETVKAEGDKLIQEEKNKLDKLKSDRDGLKLQIKQIELQELENTKSKNKQATDDAIAKEKERQDKLKELRGQELEIIKELNAREKASAEALTDAKLAGMTDGIDKEIALLERAYGKERDQLIEGAIQNELAALDERFVEGKVKEAEYLAEIEKIRLDGYNKLTDSEKKLLEEKEKAKNNSIDKLRKEADDKLKNRQAEYQKFKEGQITDADQKAILAAENTFKTEKDQLDKFLKDKIITEEQYSADLAQITKKRNDEIDKINGEARNKEIMKTKTFFDSLTGVFNTMVDGASGLFASIGGSLSSGLSQVMELSTKTFDQFDFALGNMADKVNAYAQAIGGAIQSVLGAVSEEQKARLEENLTNIEETYNTEVATLDAKTNYELEQQQRLRDEGLITEEQYQKSVEGINNLAAKTKYDMELKRFNQEESLRKKAFEQEKQMKIASAIISGLQGAVAAFAGAMQLGPVAGPIVGGILAGVVAAMTAVNVAQISATQYKGGTPPSAPQISSGAEGASGQVSGAMGAPTPSPTTLVGSAMLTGNTGGQQQDAGQRQMPMRAYVLEADITQSQNTISTYEQRAEIG